MNNRKSALDFKNGCVASNHKYFINYHICLIGYCFSNVVMLKLFTNSSSTFLRCSKTIIEPIRVGMR